MNDSTTEPPPPQSMSDDEKPPSMMNVSYGGDTEEVKNNKSLKPSLEKEACDATSGLECKCDWQGVSGSLRTDLYNLISEVNFRERYSRCAPIVLFNILPEKHESTQQPFLLYTISRART